MAYESYNAYLSVTKSTPSDIYKDDFQELVNAEYENTTTLKTVLHNGNSITVRVVGKFNTETLSKRNDNYQKIIFRTPDYEVKVGDIFEFDGAKWICTDVTHTTVSKSCTVTKSYYDLNVYKNGISYKVPCIVEDITRLYSMGTDENKYIIQPSTDIIIRVPHNEVTTLIKRGDTYKLGNNNYKVNDLSDIINPGLLILKLEWTAEEQHLPNYSINILNGDNIQVDINDTLVISCEVLDGNVILSPPPPLFYYSSNEAIATIDENGVVTILNTGVVEFTVSLVNDKSIYDVIQVEVVADKKDNFTYILEGADEIIKGDTQTYLAQKYNNGVLVENVEFTFEIISSTTPISAYTLSIVDNNKCIITAKSAVYTITLKAIDKSNGKYVEKMVKLRNLF